MKKTVLLFIILFFNINLYTIYAQTSYIDSLENLLARYPKEDSNKVNTLNEISYKI